MERRDWIVYPWQVEAKIDEWRRQFPQELDVKTVEQYTRHKVFAVTVTNPDVDRHDKRGHLFFVPHAHEPAGTAGCMNFISQLLTGKHLDGTPSTLMRESILRQAILTFIPDANPFGRARSPEPYWEGRRYNNREFINMVFGIGELYSDDARKPRWERYKRVDAFSMQDVAPARLGLVYEQVGEYDYVEPGRYDERASLVKLIRMLRETYTYDQVLSIHQTEFEGRPEVDCEAILPDIQEELPKIRQEYNEQWACRLVEAWQGVGGLPRQDLRISFSDWVDRLESHKRMKSSLIHELQAESALLTLEIRNNTPETPAEQQLLLMDVAIWRSVEYLLRGV